jgi:PAS domain S-box-containing protein
VLDDRKKAARLEADAARQEDAQKKVARAGDAGLAGLGAAVAGLGGGGADGLIVCNEAGVIKTATAAAAALFGYGERELSGRDVAVLVNPPHSLQHAAYIANYLSTGVSSVVGHTRRVEGRHKSGHALAVQLQVSTVDSPAGILFACVVRPLPEDSITARVTINRAGAILAVSPPLAAMFGWRAADLLHQNVNKLMPARYAQHHDAYLSAAAAGRGKGVAAVAGRRLENGMVLCPASHQLRQVFVCAVHKVAQAVMQIAPVGYAQSWDRRGGVDLFEVRQGLILVVLARQPRPCILHACALGRRLLPGGWGS